MLYCIVHPYLCYAIVEVRSPDTANICICICIESNIFRIIEGTENELSTLLGYIIRDAKKEDESSFPYKRCWAC